MVSQVLTLYTTPVIYLYLDRFGKWCSSLWARLTWAAGAAAARDDLTQAAT